MPTIADLRDEYEFLEADDRYRLLIDLGRELEPMPGARLTCWVGATERSEFLRQNGLLANMWKGLGAETEAVEEPDRHHFNVLDGLADQHHPLTRTLLS